MYSGGMQYSNVKEYKKINAEWYRRVMVRNVEE